MEGKIELNKLPSVFDDGYPQPIDATPVLYTVYVSDMIDTTISLKDIAEAQGYVRFTAFYSKLDKEDEAKWICGIVERDEVFAERAIVLWETECYSDTLDFMMDEPNYK